LRALGGAAGGRGVALVVFVLLAAVGLSTLAWRKPAVATLAAVTIALPLLALGIASAAGLTADRLGPRHLIFVLPLWIALIATGASRLGSLLPRPARVAVLAAVVVAAAVAPAAVSEPRTIPTGTKRAVTAPAAWLRGQLTPGAVLYPYSPVFLAALPAAREAQTYSREPVALARIAARTHATPAVFMSIPLREPVDAAALRSAGVRFRAFSSWLILESRGPFVDGRAALGSAAAALRTTAPLVTEPNAHAYLEQLSGAACAALVRLDSGC
jgi:hypothetical protein